MFRPDLESSPGGAPYPLPRPGSSVDVGADPLLARIRRIVDPGRQPGGHYTFRASPGADLPLAWEAWLEGVFRPLILPHFTEVMELATRNHAREICALDWELDARMNPDARTPSRLAGHRLLAALGEAQGLRMVNKWMLWAQSGRMPAHFSTLYAAQCAIFSFPVRQSLLAYLQMEYRAVTASRVDRGLRQSYSQHRHSLQRAAELIDLYLAGREGLVILGNTAWAPGNRVNARA